MNSGMFLQRLLDFVRREFRTDPSPWDVVDVTAVVREDPGPEGPVFTAHALIGLHDRQMPWDAPDSRRMAMVHTASDRGPDVAEFVLVFLGREEAEAFAALAAKLWAG